MPSYSIVHPTVSQSLLFVGAFFQLLPAVPLFSSQQYNAGVAKIFESIQYSSLSFSAVMLVDWLLSVFFYFSGNEKPQQLGEIFFYIGSLSTVIVPLVVLTGVLLEQNQQGFQIQVFSGSF